MLKAKSAIFLAGKKVPVTWGTAIRTWKLLWVAPLLASMLTVKLAAETVANHRLPSGEISCSGTVRYALSEGPWLAMNQGTAPIVMPLKVETGETVGRVTVPSLGVIEGQKNSSFALSRGQDGEAILNVTRGTVLYSLRSESRLHFLSPIPLVEAVIGFTSSTSSTKPFQWTPGSLLLGEITVEGDNSFHLFNLNGEAVILREGKPVRTMVAGRALQVIYVKPQESVPLDAFKMFFMPLANGGRLIFKDQYMPNNWNLVAPPAGGAAPRKDWIMPPAAVYDDRSVGGVVRYEKRNSNDDGHDRPPPQDATPSSPQF